MSWSTRELAEIAGTTVKTVRHYHAVGLLDEPERRPNGYKTYGSQHLARLLSVQRMRDIGFSISRIVDIMASEATPKESALQLLEEVESSIRRLETVRQDLLESLEHPDHWTLPAGFSAVSGHLSTLDRVMLSVQSRYFTDEALQALQAMNSSTDPVDVEFAELREDANEERIDELAARMAPMIHRARAENPMPEDVVPGDGFDERRAARSIGSALSGLYNRAQLQVVARAVAIVEEST